MKSYSYMLGVLLAAGLVFVSCKKDKDDDKNDDNNTTENKAPTVSITYPTEGFSVDIVGSDTTLTLTVDASDSDGSVSKVKFYIDNVYIGQDLTAPYSYEHNFAYNGLSGDNDYILDVTAIDDDNDSTSVRRYVTIAEK